MSSYSLLKNVPHIRKIESGGVKKKDTRINNTGQCFGTARDRVYNVTHIMMIDMRQPSGCLF